MMAVRPSTKVRHLSNKLAAFTIGALQKLIDHQRSIRRFATGFQHSPLTGATITRSAARSFGKPPGDVELIVVLGQLRLNLSSEWDSIFLVIRTNNDPTTMFRKMIARRKHERY
jgi:hypothetical protein